MQGTVGIYIRFSSGTCYSVSHPQLPIECESLGKKDCCTSANLFKKHVGTSTDNKLIVLSLYLGDILKNYRHT